MKKAKQYSIDVAGILRTTEGQSPLERAKTIRGYLARKGVPFGDLQVATEQILAMGTIQEYQDKYSLGFADGLRQALGMLEAGLEVHPDLLRNEVLSNLEKLRAMIANCDAQVPDEVREAGRIMKEKYEQEQAQAAERS